MNSLHPKTPRSPWLVCALCLALVAAGAVTYANGLSGVFVFDDISHIVDAPEIEQFWPPWRAIRKENGRISERPLVKLSLAFNYALGGRNVVGYHLFNITIHLLAALTLFGVVRRTLLCPRCRGHYQPLAAWLAFAVALLWLLHPLTTQAVTYVIQRAESLVGLFYLWTLYCVTRLAHGGRATWAVAAVIGAFLGMSSKEVMVTAPLASLLVDRTLWSGSFTAAIRQRPWLYTGLAASWLVPLALLGPTRPFRGETVGFAVDVVTPVQYILTQPQVILHYLRLSLWPEPLCLDYGWAAANSVGQSLPSLVAIGGLLVAAVVGFHRHRPLSLLGVLFFLILAPSSGVVPIADLAVEHRTYLPLASVMISLVLFAHTVLICGKASWPWSGLVLLGGVAACLGMLTWQRNSEYQNPLSLWQQTVRVAPLNPRALTNLGGQLHTQKRTDEAVRCYYRSLLLLPNYGNTHYSLAIALTAQRHFEKAIYHYRQAIKCKPDLITAHYDMGVALASLEKLPQALEQFRIVEGKISDSAEFQSNLGAVLAGLGKHKQAREHYHRALQLDSTYAKAHYNLAMLLADEGQVQSAVEHYRRALAENFQIIPAHNNLGVLLARLGWLDEAIYHFQQALALQPDYSSAQRNLNAARIKQKQQQKPRPTP